MYPYASLANNLGRIFGATRMGAGYEYEFVLCFHSPTFVEEAKTYAGVGGCPV